jgi:hypothetical protein
MTGWVEGLQDAAPARVDIYLGDLQVMSTWAMLPAGAHATGRRTFHRRVDDLWRFSDARGALRVEVNGVALPFNRRRGISRVPSGGGSAGELASLLAAGHVFGSDGRLRLSKRLDSAWQRQVLGFYDQVRSVLASSFRYDVMVCYGTLLGVARDGDFIGYDDDFDAAYISRHREPRHVVEEVGAIAKTLIDHGLDVECLRTTLHIYDPVDRRTRIDLYHLYFDAASELAFPFGVAGTSSIALESWRGCVPFDLHGREVMVPGDLDAMAAHIYGDGWRVPDPAFEWSRSRRRFAAEVVVSPKVGDDIHRYAVKARNGLLRGGMARLRTRVRRRAKRVSIRVLPSPLRVHGESSARSR